MNISPYIYPGLPKVVAKQAAIERMSVIGETVAKHYGISLEDMRDKSHKRSVALPRQLCMYLTNLKTSLILNDIGGFFGGRHHSTVLYAKDTILDLKFTDRQFRTLVEEFENTL